jgi:hypothetical protein
MSIQYCEYCNKYIDTDFDTEHFDSEGYECIQEEVEKAEHEQYLAEAEAQGRAQAEAEAQHQADMAAQAEAEAAAESQAMAEQYYE